MHLNIFPNYSFLTSAVKKVQNFIIELPSNMVLNGYFYRAKICITLDRKSVQKLTLTEILLSVIRS